MQTLVEADGSVNTAISRNMRRGVVVDRKAEMMVTEMKRYGMNVTAIGEMKWFGQEVYELEGFTILHSGQGIRQKRMNRLTEEKELELS